MATTYDSKKDYNAWNARGPGEPGADASALSPNDSQNLAVYAKAVRIYVPMALNEATMRVTPAVAADDANTITLKFPSGLYYEPISIRKLWATGTTPGVEIHGYTV